MHSKLREIANIIEEVAREECVVTLIRLVCNSRNPYSPQSEELQVTCNEFHLRKQFPEHFLDLKDIKAEDLARDILVEFFAGYYDIKLKNYLAKH